MELFQNEEVKGKMWMDGGEALAMGVIAGECNFLSLYPMSLSLKQILAARNAL
jgi:pyruvate/2-oxoacid:ferredoxin oxidoreductase alpha subunit